MIVFPNPILFATPCRSGAKAIERTHGIEDVLLCGRRGAGLLEAKGRDVRGARRHRGWGHCPWMNL